MVKYLVWTVAIAMYENMGYCVYRTVAGYYAGGVKEGEEDAFGESLCTHRTQLMRAQICGSAVREIWRRRV